MNLLVEVSMKGRVKALRFQSKRSLHQLLIGLIMMYGYIY